MQDKKSKFDKTGLSEKEKAERIFDAIDKFIKENPKETMAPNLVITQDWKPTVIMEVGFQTPIM